MVKCFSILRFVLRRGRSLLLALLIVTLSTPFETSPVFAQSCTPEKVDELRKAGFQEKDISELCPEIESTSNKSRAQLNQLRELAQSGNPVAAYKLGKIYENGEGVVQNYTEAYVWYARAAASGNKDYMRALDALEKRMSPDAVAKAQATVSAPTPKTPAPLEPTPARSTETKKLCRESCENRLGPTCDNLADNQDICIEKADEAGERCFDSGTSQWDSCYDSCPSGMRASLSGADERCFDRCEAVDNQHQQQCENQQTASSAQCEARYDYVGCGTQVSACQAAC